MNQNIAFNKPVPQNFIPETIHIDHYVLGDGNLAAQVLMPDGHGWGPYLPVGESQFKNGIDPQSCPAGGMLNMIEAIGKKKFNQYASLFQTDLSERYLSIISGMTGHGGNPHQVAETLRLVCGAIPEVFLAFDKTITTIEKYFSPRPITYALFKVGYSWLQKYEFKHQWLFYGDETIKVKQAAIKEGLKYSPVGVSGYAWSRHPDGKYYHDGPDIHWFIVFDYVDGDHWLAFDTYPDENGSYIKKLDWNYNFGYAKGGTLNRKLGANGIDLETTVSALIPYIKYRIKSFSNTL